MAGPVYHTLTMYGAQVLQLSGFLCTITLVSGGTMNVHLKANTLNNWEYVEMDRLRWEW